MTATNMGKKHICSNCMAKFYDLGKDPAICPKCHTVVKSTQKPNINIVAQNNKTTKNKNDEEEAIKLVANADLIDDSEDDEEISSLSELDDRPVKGQHAAHADDVEESKLMEDMKNYDVLLDKSEEIEN